MARSVVATLLSADVVALAVVARVLLRWWRSAPAPADEPYDGPDVADLLTVPRPGAQPTLTVLPGRVFTAPPRPRPAPFDVEALTGHLA